VSIRGSFLMMVSRVLTEKLFSAGEFRFSLGISAVEPAGFFRNFEGEELLELRRQALDSSSGDYCSQSAMNWFGKMCKGLLGRWSLERTVARSMPWGGAGNRTL